MNTNGATSVEKTFGDMKTIEDYLANHFGRTREQMVNDEQRLEWDRKKIELEKEAQLRESLMSPAGALRLPPLLEARRHEWLITDGAFRIAPAFNRVYVHQIPRHVNKKKGLIHMPDTTASKEQRSCHRGVLVAAGGLALDALRSNGYDLGHVVHFIHVNPMRLFVDYAVGLEPQVLVMTVDCIAGSEDLAQAILDGRAKWEIVDGKHQLRDAEGNLWDPQMPQDIEVF